ncbi:MAG: HNH endonuclease [Nanoarchaeota archaeon]|nr:HNH endonuclease [Nanoarchaeota archaeon]MBU1103426.1 HNH endonuclease [Nanoarchaeota archaeon]
MKPLILSFAPPEKWRNPGQTRKLKGEEWQTLRKKILERDNYTCVCCGYKSEKYQIVDHINGDSENNKNDNLQVVCQMCNLIKHSGQGCEIVGVVDLYGEAKYNQNVIIKITRKMRDEGASDNEIIRVLKLQNKKEFKMNIDYLKKLFGFITSRKPNDENDMYGIWLKYYRREVRKKRDNMKQGLVQERL